MTKTNLDAVLARAESLLQRLEQFLPAVPPAPDFNQAIAFRWRKANGRGALLTVARPHAIRLSDLHGIDEQKQTVEQNTRQFVERLPANNVLLTGARGTGKSSLVKALLNKYASKGLRLIEVEKQDLVDLPDIVELIANRPERYIVYCDDLSFDADEPGYKALKVVLDGTVAAQSENVLVYATSNRRHLMPEYMSDNLDTKHVGDEIHPSEAVEEKVSLSERFGLWLSFYPFDQDDYLRIVTHWVEALQLAPSDANEVRAAALVWALRRGSRSGRAAYQFARDYAGRSARRRKPAR